MTAALPPASITPQLTDRPITTAFNPHVKLQVAQRGLLQETQLAGLEVPTAAIAGTVLAMADTFATSLSFGLVEDDDLENYLNEVSPRFGEFFEAHRFGLGAVGDLIGAFIPGTLAIKAVRSTSFFGKIANKVLGPNTARFITSTGKSNQALFAQNFQEARIIARSGVNLRAASFAKQTLSRNKNIGRSVSDIIIETIAAEVAIGVTMSNSELEDLIF